MQICHQFNNSSSQESFYIISHIQMLPISFENDKDKYSGCSDRHSEMDDVLHMLLPSLSDGPRDMSYYGTAENSKICTDSWIEWPLGYRE